MDSPGKIIPSVLPVKVKQKQYKQKFRTVWLDAPELKDWIKEVHGDPSKAYCCLCRVYITAKYSDLINHSKTRKHINASDSNLPLFGGDLNRFVAGGNTSTSLEANIAFYLACHSAFVNRDQSLTDLFKSSIFDNQIASSKIGIIGGSGLNNPELFEDARECEVTTPFGDPSDVLLEGKIGGVPCVLLARHGRKHTIMPTNVNYRANIWALKSQGCTHVIVSTACGSLQEHIKPGDFVIIDQFIDRTTKRHQTFYDGADGHPPGILHLPMDTPFCKDTREIIANTCTELGYPVHAKGTVVTIEGPRFSSRAESRMFRQWGGDVINMTTVPEVVLARELGLFYAAVAMATDYDCWREDGEAVNVEKVLETMKMNCERATELLKRVVSKIAAEDWDSRIKALKDSVGLNIMLPN